MNARPAPHGYLINARHGDTLRHATPLEKLESETIGRTFVDFGMGDVECYVDVASDGDGGRYTLDGSPIDLGTFLQVNGEILGGAEVAAARALKVGASYTFSGLWLQGATRKHATLTRLPDHGSALETLRNETTTTKRS